MRGGLVETLENFVQLVLGDVLTIVTDEDVGMVGVMAYTNAYLTTGRSEFERVGKDVDNDFVEILTVNPHRKTVGVVLVMQTDMFRLCLVLEEGVDVAHKTHQVGFLHAHLHHSLVYLAQVHHLVDQMEDALCIALDGFVDALTLGVVVLFHQREKRGDDERHRSANLMADVHKEAKLGLAHLLCVNVLLQRQAGLLLTTAVGDVIPHQSTDCKQVEEISPSCLIPSRADDNGELSFGGHFMVTLGLHTKTVGSWREVGERQFVYTCVKTGECLAVDAVVISDVLRIVIGERGELDGE